MKLRNIFTALAAVLAFTFVGCQEEERFLDEVKVSQSYIAIPAEGGQVEVTVTAAADWEITDIPEWLTVSPATGAAGETVVKFSAEATTATNEAILSLLCDGATQFLTALQLTEKVELPISTCAQVNAGEDGVRYRVKGTVTSIANTQYGNWYLQDETGTVYVYGTLYDGAEKQFTKHGIEVGDIVTVEGPRKNYNGTIELVNVDVISIEKSLIKVDEVSPEEAVLPIEGGEFTVTLTAKGDGVSVVIPEAAKSWLSVTGVQTSGTTAVVTFYAAANAGGDRSTEIEFVTKSKGVEYKAFATLSQAGSIIDATIPEFLAAAEDATLYRVKGTLKSFSANEQYHNASATIVDGAGNEVDLYRLVAVDANIEDLGLKAGDQVTVVGKRSSYNGKPQMAAGCYVESYVSFTAATIAEFLAAPVSTDVTYIVTGKIVNIKEISASYKNATLTIADENGTELYIFRMKPAVGGKAIEEIGLKVGDVLTVTGQRGEYNGSAQMVNGYYVSHEASEPGDDPVTTTLTLTNAEILAALTSSSTSYTEYSIESASGTWTVNASQNKANTFLQCRGKKGAYIKTPAFDKEIKSVTIHFSEAKSVYANNVYCVFPATWTAPTADAAYPEDGNVGRAVTDGSHSLTIPVEAGNKQVYISIIGTYAYYLDHIDVAF